MTSRNSFIYANQWGVWCFQRRFSKSWLSVHPWSPAMFRQSLGTKDKNLALKLARKVAVMLDELQNQFFETEEGFARALKLYSEYVKAAKNYPKFEDFQRNYLDLLDDETDPSEVGESGLVDKVQEYLRAKSIAQGTYHEDIFVKNKVNTSGVASQLETLRLEIKDLNDSKKDTSLDPITLREAIDNYIEVKKVNWKKNGDSESSLREKYFPLWLEVVGNKTTDQLKKADVIKYRNAVLNLPVNRHKVPKYKNLTIDQIIAQRTPEADQISKRTKSNYLSKVSGLLIWLESEGYLAQRIDSPLRGVIKLDKSAHEERDPYSDEELRQLFYSDTYLEGKHKFASFFWIPLIGLLSGARENEICQLELSDIKFDAPSGLWVFSINQDNPDQTNKSVKKPHHKRLLPIHQILIDLGFLDFYELQMALGEKRLFPELPFMKGKGHIDKFQRWYNRTYKNHCGIDNEKVSFHSFRHNVINYLTHKLEVGEDRTFHYLGQKPKGGVQRTRYLKPSELIMFANILNRMNFDTIINFSEIHRWSDQPFAVKLFEQQATLKELQEFML
jgi:integrase